MNTVLCVFIYVWMQTDRTSIVTLRRTFAVCAIIYIYWALKLTAGPAQKYDVIIQTSSTLRKHKFPSHGHIQETSCTYSKKSAL